MIYVTRLIKRLSAPAERPSLKRRANFGHETGKEEDPPVSKLVLWLNDDTHPRRAHGAPRLDPLITMNVFWLQCEFNGWRPRSFQVIGAMREEDYR